MDDIDFSAEHVKKILATPQTFDEAVGFLKSAIWNYENFNPVEVRVTLPSDERDAIHTALGEILHPFYQKRRDVICDAAKRLIEFCDSRSE